MQIIDLKHGAIGIDSHKGVRLYYFELPQPVMYLDLFELHTIQIQRRRANDDKWTCSLLDKYGRIHKQTITDSFVNACQHGQAALNEIYA